MSESAGSLTVEQAWEAVQRAAQQGQLSSTAAENIRRWLTQDQYAPYRPELLDHIAQGRWDVLDEVFWTVIPFGTGGRRGRMYPIGTNAINDRTIGESAQGLANYLRQQFGSQAELSCAIGYDTRHRSEHFARLCAEVLSAAGFRIYFLQGYHSTPSLSVAVRHMQATSGIMVTASHNPPTDNAVKVYWSTGGQLVPPHDQGVIEQVMRVEQIDRVPFDQAVQRGQIVFCQEEVDRAYLQGVLSQSTGGPRELKILYSPMHGVGVTSVVPALKEAGFEQLEIYGPQATPDGDFPNVPGHVANPENPETFDCLIEHAQATGAELVISSDPDADRLGAAAPVVPGGPWRVFTGNQLGVLLTHFLLEHRRQQGTLSPEHYVVKTLVTTEMIRRVADRFGVRTVGNLLVGFKWIAQAMDRHGPELFVFGTEESHGYLAGHYARDKDAAVAALLLCELAARCRQQGITLHQYLDRLYLEFGCHRERLLTFKMPGAKGMEQMQALMDHLRHNPPEQLAGLPVARLRDYGRQVQRLRSGETEPLSGPQGNLVFLDLEPAGNAVAVRPSGTEPKVKCYLFTREDCSGPEQLSEVKASLEKRLDQMAADLETIVARFRN